jgi:hypothetical protein
MTIAVNGALLLIQRREYFHFSKVRATGITKAVKRCGHR